jgi:tetracycline 7-halogenase / FADH2 O2-dependent halogenase
MIREHAEIAIVGAGFAGSFAALVMQKIGRRCVLLERGTHPRFAIGESSTPTANLTLESLCKDYDLPQVLPLTKYGRWQRTYPSIACGLKRGFSFFQHEPGWEFQATPDHANELLVAASPNDEIGDTHWFRAEVDHFFAREVQAAGIPYLDQTEIASVEHGDGWQLKGRRGAEEVVVTASLVIDATGPAGFLAKTLGIATDPAELQTNSWSIYSHFTGVELWENLLAEMGGSTADHPYPCDAAAVHHVLADGWMWVLRFNNGITSAGIAFDGNRRPHVPNQDPQREWEAALAGYPSLARQFSRAERIRPWVRTGRMQRHARRVAGVDWAMLPHAAYFFDPLFSAGNAHTLLGIQRLARILERTDDRDSLAEQLAEYERRLFREITFLDWLIHGCYCTFGRFELLSAYVMYYFAGAIQSEMHIRSGAAGADTGFLFSEHEPFRAAVKRSYDALIQSEPGSLAATKLKADFHRQVASDIASYNPVGFCDPAKRNMYRCL